MLARALALVALVAVLASYSSRFAHAMLWNEVGDAGDSILTAQDVGGGITAISGSLPMDFDSDWYKLTYDTAVAFTAFNLTRVPTEFAFSDITLYDSGGSVVANCAECFDVHANMGTAFINTILTAGTYYLALSDTEFGVPIGEYGLQFAPATVPVPAALPLFLSALAVGGLVVRRRRRAGAQAYS